MASELITVTLDGPAGVGKTTLAKRLAHQLKIAYLDTGAMFRAIAFHLGEGAWDWPEDQIQSAMENMVFSIRGTGAESTLLVGGTALGDEIRTEQTGMWASNIATLPVVRNFLKKAQQDLGAGVSLVAEGRDMGTVVFPEASHKFFLDATCEERARRRWLQLKSMGKEPDLKAITSSIEARDKQDRNRAVAPLKPAEDAIIVDTSTLDIGQVFDAIMERM